MRCDVYAAMLGIGEGDEAETMASLRRGLVDLEAGRTFDLDEAMNDLESRYEP
jgi:hypothetical protein